MPFICLRFRHLVFSFQFMEEGSLFAVGPDFLSGVAFARRPQHIKTKVNNKKKRELLSPFPPPKYCMDRLHTWIQR